MFDTEDIYIINDKPPPLPFIELITPVFLKTLFINLLFQRKKRKGSNQAWMGMVCNHTSTMVQTVTTFKAKASDYKKILSVS